MNPRTRLFCMSLALLLLASFAAAQDAKRAPAAAHAPLDDAQVDEAIAALMAPLDRSAGENPYKLHAEIQDLMSKYAPIVRDEPGLETGLDKLRDIGQRSLTCGTGGSATRAFNPGWHTAYDVRSMLINAEALFLSALARQESRGAHARSDFPKLDDQLARVNFVVDKTSDGMRVSAQPIPPMPDHLAAVLQRSYAVYTPEEIE